MSRRWFVALSVTLSLSVLALRAVPPQRDQTEAGDLKLAEQAILLTVAAASAGVHGNQSWVGPGPNPFELGLAVVTARNSPRSLRALASLVRFHFDGMFAEEYEADVLAKGPKIVTSLRALNPDQLHEQCAREFADLQKDRSAAAVIKGAREGEVCESVSGMKELIGELLGALKRRSRAGPSEW